MNTSLSLLWDNLLSSYGNFGTGKGYQILKDKYNIEGSVRAVEATYGKNGWHLHIHAVFFHTAKININQFTDAVYKRWNYATNLNNVVTSLQGFKVLRSFSDSGLASYLSKNSYNLSTEITKGQLKKYKQSRTPFTILSDLKTNEQLMCDCVDMFTGEILKKLRCDFCLWSEWELASKGRRQLGYSGKKNLYDILSQLEINTEEVEDDLIIFDNKYQFSIPNKQYKKLRELQLVIPVLEALQRSKEEAEQLLIINKILFFSIELLPAEVLPV
jgi:hypothetical protein